MLRTALRALLGVLVPLTFATAAHAALFNVNINGYYQSVRTLIRSEQTTFDINFQVDSASATPTLIGTGNNYAVINGTAQVNDPTAGIFNFNVGGTMSVRTAGLFIDLPTGNSPALPFLAPDVFRFDMGGSTLPLPVFSAPFAVPTNNAFLASLTKATVVIGQGQLAQVLGPASFNISVSQVPLPAAGWLFLSGVGALGLAARRRKQAVAI